MADRERERETHEGTCAAFYHLSQAPRGAHTLGHKFYTAQSNGTFSPPERQWTHSSCTEEEEVRRVAASSISTLELCQLGGRMYRALAWYHVLYNVCTRASQRRYCCYRCEEPLLCYSYIEREPTRRENHCHATYRGTQPEDRTTAMLYATKNLEARCKTCILCYLRLCFPLIALTIYLMIVI